MTQGEILKYSTESTSSQPHLLVEEPWQLRKFRQSLKKQQKLKTLLDVIGPLDGLSCVLLTCGDNNGALNWYFKNHGGSWTWVEAEADSLDHITELTEDPVYLFNKEDISLPLLDNSFDVVLTIDVHEHIKNPHNLNVELNRIAKSGGRVIVTTPAGNNKKLANRIKRWVGMRKEDYGHVVDGYDTPELIKQLKEVGLKPYKDTSYSRFFTEIVELCLNIVYVKGLSRRANGNFQAGQIAPQNKSQIKSVEKFYRLYSYIFPIFLMISKLDAIIGFQSGYAVVVATRKD
jgi:SAM-dependent methyltransferase